MISTGEARSLVKDYDQKSVQYEFEKIDSQIKNAAVIGKNSVIIEGCISKVAEDYLRNVGYRVSITKNKYEIIW